MPIDKSQSASSLFKPEEEKPAGEAHERPFPAISAGRLERPHREEPEDGQRTVGGCQVAVNEETRHASHTDNGDQRRRPAPRGDDSEVDRRQQDTEQHDGCHPKGPEFAEDVAAESV